MFVFPNIYIYFYTPKYKAMNFIDVYYSLLENKEAAYNILDGTLNPPTGYMVSLEGHEKTYPSPRSLSHFNSMITDYLQRDKWDVINQGGVYLGLWISGAVLYIDLSENIDDRVKAIKEGFRREQTAIWDCASKEEIIIGSKVSSDPDIETDRFY